MTDIKLLIVLLPVIFMIHDFEEIIMFNPWLTKNREELKHRFPKFEKFLTKKHFFEYSTSAFAIAVMFEFILITTVTYLSLYFNSYTIWFAAFMAIFFHFLVHIGQWVAYKKYVPVVITSFISIPYCIYTFISFIKFSEMTSGQLILWMFIGIVITALSFFPAYYLASKFENRKNTKYL